jgi:hypothetical protein
MKRRLDRIGATAVDKPDETALRRIDDETIEHLKLFAAELSTYEHLTTRFVLPVGKDAVLRVATKDNPKLTEDVTCVVTDEKPVLRWSWGAAIYGDALAAQAEAVAYVLNAKAQVSN